MINYVEKGIGLHDAIRKAGHVLRQEGAVWISSDDTAVQAIIDSYDPLPTIKKDAIAAVKQTGLAKIQAIFPAIDSFDKLDFYSQFWLSVASAARAPTTRFSNVIAIYQAGANAIAQINAAASASAAAAVVPNWP